MSKLLVYIVGLVPLAFGQHWLRSAIGDMPAFGIVIVYVVLLRIVAEKLGSDRKT